jgi:hypothetical protein
LVRTNGHPTKRIAWAPSVTDGIAPVATYDTAIIHPGQSRHRATKTQKTDAGRAAFLSASITVHPGLTSPTWSKRCSAKRRSYRRRSRRHHHHHLPAVTAHHARHHSRQKHIIITHHTTSFAAQVTTTGITLHYAHTVIDADTGESFKHAQLVRGAIADGWMFSTANKLGGLTKGILPYMPTGTETMLYPHHDQLPVGRRSTYAHVVATERPHKKEINRPPHCWWQPHSLSGQSQHPPHRTYPRSKCSSTVSFLLLAPG